MNLTFITDIGDSFVLGCMVITGAGYLLFQGCRKGASALLLSLSGSAFLIGLLKLFVRGCNEGLHRYGIYSPSGHAALSVAVLGTYALLLAGQLQGLWRFVPLLLLVPLISAIALTRLILGFHTAPEIIIGLIAGGIALLPAVVFLRYNTIEKFNVYGFMLSALAVALIFNGFRLPAENFIVMLSQYIKTHVALCAK